MKITRPWLTTGRLGHLAAFLFGAQLPLAFAPIDFWPCALFSMLGFIVLIQGLSPKQGFWRGWWYGFGVFLVGVSWVYVSIHVYGGTPLILAIIMTVGFAAFLAFPVFAVFGYLFSRFHLERYTVISFPALWVLSEWIRTWVLTGFPWLFAGYGMIDTPLAGYAPLQGVLMVSWATATTAALIVWGAGRAKQRLKIALPLIAALWVGGYLLDQVAWTEQENELKVSLIQTNIPQDKKWLPEQLPITKEMLHDKTLTEITGPAYHADVVVWPEAAITQFLNSAWPYIEEMEEIANNYNTTIITGVPHRERGEKNFQ